MTQRFWLGTCLASFIGFAAFLSGCGGSRTRGVSKSVLSAEQEVKIGQELAMHVADEMGLVEDPALLKYVQEVGARVARKSPRQDFPYSFQIVNTPEPNAFALPGGYLYVSRGLLALCNSEEELAGVLGHEIGHVAAHHASQTLTRAAVMSPVTIATSIGGSIAGIVAPRVGGFIAGVGETTTGLVLSPHSRTQEREADRLGQEMMAHAGYNPAGLTRLLESLRREESLESSTGTRTSSFLATHPATAERVEQTGARAETLTFTARPGIAADRAALFAHLDGLLVGEDPRKGLFVKSQFINPKYEFTMKFPKDWKSAQEPNRVAAQSEKGEAMILLQVLGPSDQRETLIRKSLKKMRVDAMPMQRESNGLPMWELKKRFSTSAGRLKAHVAWVDYRGRIYEMVGAASEKQFDDYAGPISKSIYSFRGMTPSDLREVQEIRLTIVQVKETMALGKLLKKYSDNEWPLERTAAYNALESDVLLSAGVPVKLALRKPYRK